MMEIRKSIIERLEKARDAIRERMQVENINASGRTSDSLRVEEYDVGVRLMIGGDRTAPAETLEIGRPGGAVPKGFYKILIQWSKDKGIAFNSDRERSTFAYFLSKRIAEEGTLRNKNHVDVYSSIVNATVSELNTTIYQTVIDFIKMNH